MRRNVTTSPDTTAKSAPAPASDAFAAASALASSRTPLDHVLGASDLLAANTSMDAVTLYVHDIDAMVKFYSTAIALDVVESSRGAAAYTTTSADGRAGAVTLGRGTTPLIVLRAAPDMPVPSRGEAGLFHTAILFETRAALAATILRVAQYAPQLFTGSADHLVSEAFYLSDPEGNGIELYVDRPRGQWGWQGSQVIMDTLPLDPNDFVRAHLTDDVAQAPNSADAVVGHVHLQVGNLDQARVFYVDTLGFEMTSQMPSALFVSAGGYHHHVAMNTWNSRGAGPRAVTLGLGEVSIIVPFADDVAALADRLRHNEVAAVRDAQAAGEILTFDDPWRNHISVTAAA
jgi:catechol 2,3-dioxygenase